MFMKIPDESSEETSLNSFVQRQEIVQAKYTDSMLELSTAPDEQNKVLKINLGDDQEHPDGNLNQSPQKE